MIKVVIIDDSVIIRKTLANIFETTKDIKVVGMAADPYEGRDLILETNPDVITLDVEMPRMDGVTFLKRLMKHHPIPVVMVSALTQKGSVTSLQALSYGAVDVVAKPSGKASDIRDLTIDIIDKVRAAARSKPFLINARAKRESALEKGHTTDKVVLIGASTGGTEALKILLGALPVNCPAIVVVQHMPAGFTESFANLLNKTVKIDVREAKDGDSLRSGLCLIAPGAYHIQLKRSGSGYQIFTSSGDLVCRHRPSVEVLFESGANVLKEKAIGVILTGMGRDGASAMLKMKKSGAYNIAQDEASSLVFGMPQEAIKEGGVDKILPLVDIPKEIMSVIRSSIFLVKR